MAGLVKTLCLLLVLFTVSAEARRRTPRKPGACPPVPPEHRCPTIEQPDRCSSDDHSCPGNQLCCKVLCGKSCKTPVTKKTGTCPPIPKFQCFMLNPPDRCQSDDFKCPNREKCCTGSCGKSCMKPVKKPGKCPPQDPFGPVCLALNPPNVCQSDDLKCPGIMKCCSGPCGTDCTTPILDKPGTCPGVPPGTCDIPNPPDKCASNDQNCPSNQKCCKVLCGKACKKPAKPKPGKCPPPLPCLDINYAPNKCHSSDFNCSGDKKCCRVRCGAKTCLNPVKKQKPGNCPLVSAQCRRLNPPDRCASDDSNCPGKQKCCKGICGKKCVQPATKKPGSCPAAPDTVCLALDPPDRCSSNDFNCPGKQKCCKGGCGTECTKPVSSKKPGSCPPVPLGQCRFLNPPDRCESNDLKCPDEQKCCKGRCGKSCVKPVKPKQEKPGGCPPVSPFLQCDVSPLPDKCDSNDANCPGAQKCCRGYCGNTCMEPRTTKPGRCPKAPLFTCLIHPLPDPCQSSDYKCPGRQKCCRGGCGTSCMELEPVPEKPDCCPPPPSVQCRIFPLPDPCSSLDSNCPGDQKCCPGTCGNSCVKPQPLPQDKPQC